MADAAGAVDSLRSYSAFAVSDDDAGLTRSASDVGLMCILDGRLETMPYGRRILAALPPARGVHELEDVREVLESGII